MVQWESKELSNKNIKPPITANSSLSPKMTPMNNSRVGVIFEGSCLKRAKVTFTTRNVVNSFIVSELDKW